MPASQSCGPTTGTKSKSPLQEGSWQVGGLPYSCHTTSIRYGALYQPYGITAEPIHLGPYKRGSLCCVPCALGSRFNLATPPMSKVDAMVSCVGPLTWNPDNLITAPLGDRIGILHDPLYTILPEFLCFRYLKPCSMSTINRTYFGFLERR